MIVLIKKKEIVNRNWKKFLSLNSVFYIITYLFLVIQSSRNISHLILSKFQKLSYARKLSAILTSLPFHECSHFNEMSTDFVTLIIYFSFGCFHSVNIFSKVNDAKL